MTVAGQTSLLVGFAALSPSGSVLPKRSTEPPARIGLGGIAFAISGALWLVLLRAIPDMGSELDLPLVAAAASCSIVISIIIAYRISSKHIRVGALAYSALVVWGLASIYVGHSPSVTEMALFAVLFAYLAYPGLKKESLASATTL